MVLVELQFLQLDGLGMVASAPRHRWHGYACCVIRGGLFWGAKTAGQTEIKLFVGINFYFNTLII